MQSEEVSAIKVRSARPLSAAACILFLPIQPTPVKANFGFTLVNISK
jgi:hypothetical protein